MRFPLRCRSYLRANLEDNLGHFPDANVQEWFLAIIADKTNLPVLVHNGRGEDRVAMLSCVWLVKSEHLAVEQAIKTAEKIKGEPLTEREIEFIRSLADGV